MKFIIARDGEFQIQKPFSLAKKEALTQVNLGNKLTYSIDYWTIDLASFNELNWLVQNLETRVELISKNNSSGGYMILNLLGD
jgi:hypothetical protein